MYNEASYFRVSSSFPFVLWALLLQFTCEEREEERRIDGSRKNGKEDKETEGKKKKKMKNKKR